MHEADTMTASSPVNADLPIDKMRRWYLAGDSNATIGGRLGLHQSKVRRVLLEAGVTMRSRREQVALTDRRAGVRPPSCDELDAGYVAQGLTAAELAARYGITEARVQALLRRCGIERRPPGIRPERLEAELAQRRPPQLVENVVALYRSGLSRRAVAERVGIHRHTVDDVLRRAGVELRDRRKLPPVSEWAHRYIDGGETGAEIAATYSVSPTTVLQALAEAGIERRPAMVRTAVAQRRRRHRVLRRRTVVAPRHGTPPGRVDPPGARHRRSPRGAPGWVRSVHRRSGPLRTALRPWGHRRRAGRCLRHHPTPRERGHPLLRAAGAAASCPQAAVDQRSPTGGPRRRRAQRRRHRCSP